MRTARKVTAAILTVLLLVSFCAPISYAAGLGNFVEINTYENGRFADVSSDAWYTANVAKVYTVGLMTGDSETTFRPSGDLTRAEAATIAARMHSIYHTGAQDFSRYQEGATRWYTQYVRYLEENAVFTWPSGTNFALAITREEFAGLLANTLPAAELQEINTIENKAIPDLYDSPYYNAIYLLYRAGVLTGENAGVFQPDRNLTRAEAAAIVSRMIDPDLRKSLTLRTNWITMYAPDGRTRLVAESEISAYEKVGWYTYAVTTMYAPDGRTRVVAKEDVAKWEAVGWYTYEVTILYAPDGRTRVVAKEDVAKWEAVGWYTYAVATMYAPDGRTRVVPKEDIAKWEAVGWYTYAVATMYAPDGRTRVVPKEDIAKWEAVGWYTYAVATMYAPDGRTRVVPKEDIAKWEAVGWYTYAVTILYAMDGRTQVVATQDAAKWRNVGWYTKYEYTVLQESSSYVSKGNYESAIQCLEKGVANAPDAKAKAVLDNELRYVANKWYQKIGSPLAIASYSINTSGKVPKVTMYFRNVGTKTITSFRVKFYCYDAKGKPTVDTSGLNNGFTGKMSNVSIAALDDAGYYWNLNGNTKTTSIQNAKVISVTFSDGTTWSAS